MLHRYIILRAASVTSIKDQFEITAQPQNAAVAREHVRRIGAAGQITQKALDDIEIAVGEAVTNAILYGSPSAGSRIVVSCECHSDGGGFSVEVRDQGHGFDPDQIRTEENADLLGGRGIRLMRALMDKVTLDCTGNGMSVHLFKRHIH